MPTRRLSSRRNDSCQNGFFPVVNEIICKIKSDTIFALLSYYMIYNAQKHAEMPIQNFSTNDTTSYKPSLTREINEG